ncbi:MAG: AAA family ATPase, partial [Sphaerochaeta sp.]|nr:AAA family ATPase [Sphaerochaeta sp.]
MKILELRFKNLNSLYGEWHIDFTESEYAYNGIFALTGPTGAGKSTILDAICLALYGSTPRLGRITQSNNDIMSRQTGECYAEVVFSSQAGRYRCHWAHHRSRKRSDGELQSPRHEIAEFDGEKKVLENKLTSVLIAVEEKTGMDFDRFTRSILLAQGGFDTFLKASVEQKSKILEQITGTKIYSDISIGVHERLRDEKAHLSTIEAETKGILILTPEEEVALTEKLSLAIREEGTLYTLVSDLAKAITWLKGIAQLEKDIEVLSKEEKELERDMLAFAPERKTLENAILAATLEGLHATLSELRKQQKEERSSLEKEALTLPVLESAAKAGSEALSKADEGTQQAKKEQMEAAPTLKQVRSLDQKIAQLTTSITEGTTAIAKDVSSIGTSKTKREAEKKKETEEQKKLSAIETYYAQHACDKNLVTELTGIVAQIQALAAKQEEVGKKEEDEKRASKALTKAEKTLATCKEKSVKLQAKHVAARANLQEKQEALSLLLGEKPLSEYRTEKEYLLREREYLARIAALEEHRQNLSDGKPCPLCGSLEHPFALGNVPLPDETEKKIEALTKIITEAEDLETKIQDLTKAERDATATLTGQEKLESDVLHTRANAHLAHAIATKALQDSKLAFT